MMSLAAARPVLLVVEAAILLMIARVAVAVLPFRIIARSIGTLVPATADAPTDECSDHASAAVASRVRWAINAVVRRSPFDILCLPRSIAAHQMLRRRGFCAILHFGVIRTSDGLSAGHAWVNVRGVGVVGYPIDPATVELGRLV
jgi:hypothetical protein